MHLARLKNIVSKVGTDLVGYVMVFLLRAFLSTTRQAHKRAHWMAPAGLSEHFSSHFNSRFKAPFRTSSKGTALIAAVALTTIGLNSCGADETTNKACVLSYASEGGKPLGEDKLRVTYRATVSNECKDTISQNSGRSVTKLSITAIGAAGIYVEKLVFGERSFDFGEKYPLAGGEFSSSIYSDTLKDWELPWADAPGTTSLSVVVPKAAANSTWPTVVTVEVQSQQ